jgi:hypothetical protein
MNSSNRRLEPRIDLRVPLKFRPVTTPPSNEQRAESINLSRRGLCFVTESPLQLGAQVEVFMTMPSEISGSPEAEIRCIARVVHVRTGWMSGKAAIGLRVERYETMSHKADRWTS